MVKNFASFESDNRGGGNCEGAPGRRFPSNLKQTNLYAPFYTAQHTDRIQNTSVSLQHSGVSSVGFAVAHAIVRRVGKLASLLESKKLRNRKHFSAFYQNPFPISIRPPLSGIGKVLGEGEHHPLLQPALALP